jgi:hypothetical protein
MFIKIGTEIFVKLKLKLFHYTPWRRLRGEEV